MVTKNGVEISLGKAVQLDINLAQISPFSCINVLKCYAVFCFPNRSSTMDTLLFLRMSENGVVPFCVWKWVVYLFLFCSCFALIPACSRALLLVVPEHRLWTKELASMGRFLVVKREGIKKNGNMGGRRKNTNERDEETRWRCISSSPLSYVYLCLPISPYSSATFVDDS